jgi:cyclophilin family peptidyl-prolyl cis-trans isomerase
MATGAERCERARPLGLLAAGLVILILALAGCNKSSPDTEGTFDPNQGNAKPSEAAGQPAKVPLNPRLHQPFKEATLDEADGQILPEKTKTGLSVGKLFEDVRKKWDTIHFTTDSGKKLLYTARINTELGDVVIDLFPEAAPNHVRSFVALAQLKYYDGLEFDRVQETSDTKTQAVGQVVQAGCPLGKGEAGLGSIGYWLKPEKSLDLKHEEGTVGGLHEESADTAACRFYITLGKTPALDGPDAKWTIFGRVTPEGLAVVKKIAARPRLATDEGRPQQPVVMRGVTIEVREGGPAAVASNGKQ